MFVVVAYDIADDRRRNRVATILSDYGERVNFSVFECEFKNSTELEVLKSKLKRKINAKNDHVRYYPICKKCRARISVQGYGKIGEDTILFA